MANGNGVERPTKGAETVVFSRESTGPIPVSDSDLAYHCYHGQRPVMDLPGILSLIRPPISLIDGPR